MPTNTILTTLPANILTYKLTQNTTVLNTLALYTITFTPTNRISATGSVKITWPSQVKLFANVTSTITTNKAYTTAHTINN